MKKLILCAFTILIMLQVAMVTCMGADSASVNTGDTGKMALIIICIVAFALAVFVFTRHKHN